MPDFTPVKLRSSSVLRCALAAVLLCAPFVLGATGTASAASSAALWIANEDAGTIIQILPNQLKTSHVPSRLTLTPPDGVEGLCFDKTNNLWVTNAGQEVVKYTVAQLKTLSHGANPSPAVTITSTSFGEAAGCAFDKNGNLWIADLDNSSVDEISAGQLSQGSNSIDPAVIITDTSEMSSANPGFVSFDKSGNLWLDGRNDNELFKFAPSKLNSSGNKAADVILSGGNLDDPGQIVFDGKGNLWVSSYNNDKVVMFAKGDLGATNSNPPAVTLTSASLNGPWGLAFRGKGPLWVVNYHDGNALEFLPGQIKTDGAPMEKVLLTGAADSNSWQITFGPKF